MKTSIRIDPYSFPLIIVAAFVMGLILAFMLGFRPQHGSSHGRERPALEAAPALVQTVQEGIFYDL